MSLLIFPNWSGEALSACIEKYFQDDDFEDKALDDDSIEMGYMLVLDSKSSDETLAQFAKWEPRCTRNFHIYPWTQYVKLGAVLRHFAYTAVALHGCSDSEIQAPTPVRALFRDPCTQIARQVSKVLAELARSIKNERYFHAGILRNDLNEALQDLNSAMKSQPSCFLGSKSTNETKVEQRLEKDTSAEVILPSVNTKVSALSERKGTRREDSAEQKQLRQTLGKIAITTLEFSDALPFAAFSSLLLELVARLDLVIEEAENLGKANV